VIIVSDSDNSEPPSPKDLGAAAMSTKTPNNAHQGGIITTSSSTNDPGTEANVQALKELLQKEEKRLTVLKTIHDLQGSVATSKTSIQGSALNKKGSRPLTSVVTASTTARSTQPKHSIVVVPGQQAKTSVSGSATSAASIAATGISSRLQQLVDNIAVDQALGSNNSSGKISLVSTPPVPSLTSITPTSHSSSSQKHILAHIGKGLVQYVPSIKPKISSSTNIRSSHEVITISDSPVSKNPPPLLSSASKIHMTSNGSIQVSTISSTGLPVSLDQGEKGHMIQAAEQSKRYREYLLKQNIAKKNFQKQIERKMVVAPYPKTFRQVWPLIPVHDSGFVRHFGLEAVSHYFESNSGTSHDKTSKMKPICNQCGCDFASAWQIRKSNSKQLLLCESCDFQNLKILQRTKLGNQLKELLEDIKKDEVKFGVECDEARKQVLLLEKKAVESPPPLTNSNGSNVLLGQVKKGLSNTLGHVNQAVLDKQVSSRVQALSSTASASMAKKQQLVLQHTQANRVVSSNSVTLSGGKVQGGTVSVIPSILGQRSFEKKENVVVVGVKRKEQPQHGSSGGGKQKDGSSPPPSKMCKPGSALDMTLNRLSKQLITRKLDEHRKESNDEQPVEESSKYICKSNEVGEVDSSVIETKPKRVTVSPVPSSSAVVTRSSSRRKGTPKHRSYGGSQKEVSSP